MRYIAALSGGGGSAMFLWCCVAVEAGTGRVGVLFIPPVSHPSYTRQSGGAGRDILPSWLHRCKTNSGSRERAPEMRGHLNPCNHPCRGENSEL